MKKSIIFEELKQVIARLKPFEAEAAINYLTGFERSNNPEQNKSAQTLKFIIANPDVDFKELKLSISPDVDKYGFNKFLVRLRNKLFDSLLLDANIQRSGAYSDWFRTKQECLKNSILITNLLGRGNDISAIQLIENVIKKAREFELYDILADVLFIKKLEFGLRKGEKSYLQIDKQLKIAKRCNEAMRIASEYNVRHYMIVDKQSSKNERVGFLSEALSELQHLYEETKVSQVGYYLHTFNMEFNQAIGDYNAAKSNGNELLKIVKNSPSLSNPNRLAGVFINIAFNDMLLLDFNTAINHTNLCLNKIGIGSYNYIVATVFKAQLHYLNLHPKECVSEADKLLATTFIKVAPFEKAKLLYIKACALFNLGQFQKAYEIFNSDSILMDSDKEGWNIGFRIMRIICLIELSSNDLADMSIESMRKHMQKSEDEKTFSKRDKTIIKILRNLEQNNFDYKKTYFKNQSLFYALGSNEEEYSWKVKSHELIVFHDWFSCKISKKAYEFSIPEFNTIEELTLNGRAES